MSLDELDRMILFDELQAKDKMGALKYAFSRMNDLYEQYQYFPVKSKKIHFLKHYFQVDLYFSLPKLCQMSLLYQQIIGKKVCYANKFCPTAEDPNAIV